MRLVFVVVIFALFFPRDNFIILVLRTASENNLTGETSYERQIANARKNYIGPNIFCFWIKWVFPFYSNAG